MFQQAGDSPPRPFFMRSAGVPPATFAFTYATYGPVWIRSVTLKCSINSTPGVCIPGMPLKRRVVLGRIADWKSAGLGAFEKNHNNLGCRFLPFGWSLAKEPVRISSSPSGAIYL